MCTRSLWGVPRGTSPWILALPSIDITQSTVLRADQVVVGIRVDLRVDPANKLVLDTATDTGAGRCAAEVERGIVLALARDAAAKRIIGLILVVDRANAF